MQIRTVIRRLKKGDWLLDKVGRIRYNNDAKQCPLAQLAGDERLRSWYVWNPSVRAILGGLTVNQVSVIVNAADNKDTNYPHIRKEMLQRIGMKEVN